jgi:predicted DNA-binding transcriptional regulator AlpA
LADAKKVAVAQSLYNDKRLSIAEICKTLRVSRATLYRYVNVKREPLAAADEARGG